MADNSNAMFHHGGVAMPMSGNMKSIQGMMHTEQQIEKMTKSKTPAEMMLEAKISKATGKKYVGKR